MSTAAVPTYVKPPRSGAGRPLAVLVAGLLALISLGFVVAGGALLWVDGQKDAQGYISTGSDPFRTSTAALATESLDIDVDGAGWVLGSDGYGKVRVAVTPRGDKPLFVGIARSRDVNAYLRRTAHTTVTDVDFRPFDADYRDHAGARRAGPPARERFWAASSSGAGRRSIQWDVSDGSWSVVVMNADGSPGVDAGVSAGAKLPRLSGYAWASLGGGLLLLTVSVGIIVLAVRPRPAGAAA